MKICIWHKCGASFAPTHHRQTYCSPACQVARNTWKMNRGASLVDLLIKNDAKGLEKARQKLVKEIAHATPRTD